MVWWVITIGKRELIFQSIRKFIAELIQHEYVTKKRVKAAA
jgi:hypothetical protein